CRASRGREEARSERYEPHAVSRRFVSLGSRLLPGARRRRAAPRAALDGHHFSIVFAARAVTQAVRSALSLSVFIRVCLWPSSVACLLCASRCFLSLLLGVSEAATGGGADRGAARAQQ